MGTTRLGFAMCGSFCTFAEVIPQMEALVQEGYEVFPIMSEYASKTDTRFGKSADINARIEEICVEPIIKTIEAAEPIGPKALLDIIVVAPCTGNTLGKMANGITDTSVTMAVKAHLRNQRPVVIAVSTNDALAGSAKNIGVLMQSKNVYFVPMRQDAPNNKPASIVADFKQICPAVKSALDGKQLQPILV